MEKLKVEKLGHGSFVEDEGTNTFNVTFTWRKPSFEHSNVHSYEVSYEFQGGFARDQLNCSSLVRTASGCLKTRMVRKVIISWAALPLIPASNSIGVGNFFKAE